MDLDSADIQAAVLAQRNKAHFLLDRLAECSTGEIGITRVTYGEGENRSHRFVSEFASSLGLEVRRDHAANTYMTLPGRDRTKPAVLTGSHLDSVPNGGNFDGAAGVVAGLLAVSTLQTLGVTPERNTTVMAVRAEESVWFQVSYIGSRSALGMLPDGAMDARRIDSGRTLADHLTECGGNPEALLAQRPFLDPARIHAFLEVHIEQAPSLVEAGCPIGICTGIPGNFRFPNAQILGRHDHVGTPRRFRCDAMMAAAELATAMDKLWQEMEIAGSPMAVTFGRFHTDMDMHGMTTVPGAFYFSLDVRAYDAKVLVAVEERFFGIVTDIEERCGVIFSLGKRAQAEVGEVSKPIYEALSERARALAIAALPLGSPASHDAAAFAAAGVPIGMILVRNEHGSHNPDEAMDIDDLLSATSVLVAWLICNTMSSNCFYR